MIKSTLKIPLAKPRLSHSDIAAAVKVLESGHLVSGPVVEDFEKGLACYLGVRHVVCVSSGTAALHVGLLALGIGPGDDVIVPAFSYPATANVVELTGARPVFVDSEPGGFNIDTRQLENKITSRVKAIMVVHNFGWPVDMASIENVAGKYGLPVFEDAACALGSTFNGKRCGALGKLAAFSFHPRKILFTGEGGALATDNDTLAEAALMFRNHGQRLGTTDFVLPGFNYRLTEFQAAMGASQLERFDSTLARRREIAAFYSEHLDSLDDIKLPSLAHNGRPNYQTYVAFIEGGRRDPLIEHLKSRGIAAGIGTYSIPHTSYYAKKYGFTSADFVNSLRAYNSLISLPLYEDMNESDLMTVVEAIKDFGVKRAGSFGDETVPLEVAHHAKI